MPLDTSTYSLALLRVDGRRWNELRRLHAQIRTQQAADGSSYLEMGHTKVMCVVMGPSEQGKAPRSSGGPYRSGAGVVVNIVIAGFSAVERKLTGRNDKRIQEFQTTVASALGASLHLHLWPMSTVAISLHVLSQDGSLLAAMINAATLACVDAGIPMTDYVAACTSGSTSSHAVGDEAADPLLDLNHQEEQELPSLTVATLGDGAADNGDGAASGKVVVLMCESRVHIGRLEGMLAVGVDGCKQVRKYLDKVVRERGRKQLREGAVERNADMETD